MIAICIGERLCSVGLLRSAKKKRKDRYTEEDIQRSQLNGFPPFWAFVWPGGYGLTRYIQENESLFDGLQDTTVLDFGCGCGSATIAAQRAGARTVICNDIDPLAVLMTSINCARNCESLQTAKLFGTTQNCLSSTIDDVVGLVKYCENKNVPSVSITDVGVVSTISCGRRIILVGDMLYDGDIGPAVLRLVNGLVDRGWAVYIGDPGRDFAKRHLDAMRTENVAEYELPSELKAQNNGLLSVCVRRLLS